MISGLLPHENCLQYSLKALLEMLDVSVVYETFFRQSELLSSDWDIFLNALL